MNVFCIHIWDLFGEAKRCKICTTIWDKAKEAEEPEVVIGYMKTPVFEDVV